MLIWWLLLGILISWGIGLIELTDKVILIIAAFIFLGWMFDKY